MQQVFYRILPVTVTREVTHAPTRTEISRIREFDRPLHHTEQTAQKMRTKHDSPATDIPSITRAETVNYKPQPHAILKKHDSAYCPSRTMDSR